MRTLPTALPMLFLLGLGGLAGVAGLAMSRASETAPEEPAVTVSDTASVSLVLATAVVRDDQGYVYDLGRDDLELRVDGAEVAIEIFERSATAPLSLVILQDLSGSMASLGKIEASREAMELVLSRLRPGDEVAVATFAGGRTEVEVPFTDEFETLREAVGLWRPYGTTALYDAVAWLPDIAIGRERLKRGALLITDGVDNDSLIPPAEARSIVSRAALPVYVLALRIGRSPTPDDGSYRYAQLLASLAAATGAQYHEIQEATTVPRATSEILNQLRYQYVLGFPTAEVPVARRQIEVTLARGRGRVDHRIAYTGGPPLTRGH